MPNHLKENLKNKDLYEIISIFYEKYPSILPQFELLEQIENLQLLHSQYIQPKRIYKILDYEYYEH
jgi:hypothetical protein